MGRACVGAGEEGKGAGIVMWWQGAGDACGRWMGMSNVARRRQRRMQLGRGSCGVTLGLVTVAFS